MNQVETVTETTREQPPLGSLTKILRMLGSIALLVAGLTFLVQSWDGFDHISRYFAFLAYSLLVTAAGYLCGITMREDKGARTFLAIGAALIPAHFCQLGALLYSRYGISENLLRSAEYPKYLFWSAPSDIMALGTTGVGLAVVSVLTFISFSVLVRKEALNLTAIYLGMNAALLAPMRNEIAAAVSALTLFGCAAYLTSGKPTAESSLRTKEGLLVRLMLWLPFLITSGRTVLLYSAEVGALFQAVILTCAAVLLFICLPPIAPHARGRAALQLLAVPFAMHAWQNYMNILFISTRTSAGEFFIRSLPLAVLLVAASVVTERSIRIWLRCAAAIIASGSVCLGMLLYPGTLATFLCVVFSMALIAGGATHRHKVPFVLGIVGLTFGLLYHVRYAISIASMSPWISLALLGTVIVILSSVLERNSEQLTLAIAGLRKRFASWEL